MASGLVPPKPMPNRAVTESTELDYEGRGMAVPYGWLSVFVMVGVNLRNSVR